MHAVTLLYQDTRDTSLISHFLFFLSASSRNDFIPLEDFQVGPFNQGSRLLCFQVGIVNDGTCGDDPGRYFVVSLSTYADLVIINPKSTRIYIYDAVECSKTFQD